MHLKGLNEFSVLFYLSIFQLELLYLLSRNTLKFEPYKMNMLVVHFNLQIAKGICIVPVFKHSNPTGWFLSVLLFDSWNIHAVLELVFTRPRL
jgi:hypothetical protein